MLKLEYPYRDKIFWLMFAFMIIGLLLFCFTCKADEYNNEKLADAIFKAEGGYNATWLYGIRSVKYKDEADARRICLNSIRNNKVRFAKQTKYTDYLEFLASRYCPIGCENDRGSNQFWVSNVKKIYGGSNC